MNSRSIQTQGAVATIAGVAIFVLVVLILHLLQPGYDPRRQLMSELALGRHGWMMLLAFAGLASAVFGVQVSIAQGGASRGYRFLLIATSLCFFAAGIFPLGTASLIHISAIAAAFVLSVLAMYLFPTSAGRASAAAPRPVSWLLAFGVAASIASSQLTTPMGISQRLAAACMLTWLGIVGWKLFKFKLN